MLPTLNYIRTGLNAYFKPNRVLNYPQQINLEVTTACNLKCNTCFHSTSEIKPKILEFSKFCYIVDILKPKLLSIAGLGEPMLHKDIFNMISYAYRKYGTIVSITTNGILLEKYAVDTIKSGLHLINVSLDAACPETYCKIRGNYYFEQIVAGINKINSIKAEMGSNLPVIGGHFVVQRDNYKEMPKMINLANSLKMANLNFCALDFHNEENHSKLVGDMTKDSLLDELKRAHKYVNNGGVKTNLNIWLRDWEETWLKYTLDKPTPVSKRPCVRPWISVYISLLGEVTPCCKLTFGTSKVVFGNIFEQDFKELWNNEKAVSFRCMIRSGRKNISVCDECVPLTILDKYHSFSKRNMLRNG